MGLISTKHRVTRLKSSLPKKNSLTVVKLLCEDQEMEIHHRYANEIMVIKQHMAKNWDFEVLHTKREGNGHKDLQHLNEEDGEIHIRHNLYVWAVGFDRWILNYHYHSATIKILFFFCQSNNQNSQMLLHTVSSFASLRSL